MSRRDFGKLRDFFQSYFHEDWVLDADTADEVLSDYLSYRWASEELRFLAAQMLEFAASVTDEAALEEALFSELGCYYRPSADGIGAREWLQRMAHLLRSHAAEVNPS